jgi:uncharacterized membrane protein
METHILQSIKPGPGKKLGWAVMLLLAIFVALISSRYLTLDPDAFFPEQRAVYLAHITMLMVHIVGAVLALVIGPFQFLPGIRKGRWLKVHRWMGRTYLLGILFGGLGGLYMAQLAFGGIIARLGFTSLAILWLFSGYKAYRHIRRKEIDQHRAWMIRNYALTFAAVSLRLWNPLLGGLGVDFTTAYIVVSWLCWIPNLLVAQWMIGRIRFSQRRATDLDPLGSPIGRQKTA